MASPSPQANPHSPVPVGHETRDVTFRPIVVAGIGFLVVAVFVFVLVRWLFGVYAEREARFSPPANPLAGSFGREVPPEPRLQTAPIEDLEHLHAAEDAQLHGYGWVDPKSGTVRIPIERAMELLAQRGLPARPVPARPAGEAAHGE